MAAEGGLGDHHVVKPAVYEHFDPDTVWRQEVEAGRARDPMLQDSKLLNETRLLVQKAESAGKFMARPRPLKYSVDWWKQWRKVTPMAATPLADGVNPDEPGTRQRRRGGGAGGGASSTRRRKRATAESKALARSASSGDMDMANSTAAATTLRPSTGQFAIGEAGGGDDFAGRGPGGADFATATPRATRTQQGGERHGRGTTGFVPAQSVSPATRAARTMLALELRAEETSIARRADVSRGGSRKEHGSAVDFSRDTSHDAPVLDGPQPGTTAAAKPVMHDTPMSLDMLHSLSVAELLDQKHRTGEYAVDAEEEEEKVEKRGSGGDWRGGRGAGVSDEADPRRQRRSAPPEERAKEEVRTEERFLPDRASAGIDSSAAAKDAAAEAAALLVSKEDSKGDSREEEAAAPLLPAIHSSSGGKATVRAMTGGAAIASTTREEEEGDEEAAAAEEEEEEEAGGVSKMAPKKKAPKKNKNKKKKKKAIKEDRTPKASVVFGQERRHLGAGPSRSPGPVYAPSLALTKERDPTVSFALSKRSGEGEGGHGGGQADGPAPGDYPVPAKIGTGRAATVAGGAPRPWDAEAKKQKVLEEARQEIQQEAAERAEAMAEAEALGIPYVEPPHFDFSFDVSRGGLDVQARREEEDEQLEEAYPFKTFGFGCSMEEHVLYGQCLDGKCCARSHVENVNLRRVRKKKKRASLSRDAARRSAITKELKGSREKTSLHFACQHGKLDIVHQLCLHGAPLGAADENGNTPLVLAAAGGHTRIVQRLLANAQFPHVTKLGFVSRRHSPQINATNDRGRTPLHAAAEGGHHLIVKLLLEAGANAELQDHDRATALDVCNSPAAFHLLRSRAEVYTRRERLEGVALKRNLIESTNERALRRATKAKAKALQGDVHALRKATEVLAERVARADEDVLQYKNSGALNFRHRELAADAERFGTHALVELCRDDDGRPLTGQDIIDELGVRRFDKNKRRGGGGGGGAHGRTGHHATKAGNVAHDGIRARLADISFESSDHVTTESTTISSVNYESSRSQQPLVY